MSDQPETVRMTHALIMDRSVADIWPFDPGLSDAYDVRDVSGVEGVAVGWLLQDDGAVAPAPVPPLTPEQIEAVVRAEFQARVARVVTPAQQSSMARYGLRLALQDRDTYTDEERADAALITAIDRWEGALIEVRERLLTAGDMSAALLDATWPAPPDGAAELAAAC